MWSLYIYGIQAFSGVLAGEPGVDSRGLLGYIIRSTSLEV